MRRLILLLVTIGCLVSLAVSGRLSIRLLLDGMLAFAFIPAIELASFAVLWRRVRAGAATSGLTFARTFDLFAAGDQAWLIWLIVVAIVTVAIPPRDLGPWFAPLFASAVVPFVLVLRADVRLFRDVLGRPAGAARRDVLWLRVLGWTAGATYFLGFAIRAEVVPRVARWITG